MKNCLWSRVPRIGIPGGDRRSGALGLGLLLFWGCSGESPPSVAGPEDTVEAVSIPALGTAATFDIGTWNLEFFGDADGGPADDAVQRQRAREIIAGSELDLWGVQEISDATDFAALLTSLPGYSGFLANDASVEGGAASYSDFDDTEQKVGVVYRSDVVEILGARIVLPSLDHEFAGRPPLEVRTRVTVEGRTEELVVVVLHAKANTQPASWQRRRDAADGLQDYLDDVWPNMPVLVVGDWNDDVDESIVTGRDTPYRGFLDAPRWTFLTAPVSEAGGSSILGFTSMVDHLLASDEALDWYEPGSASIHEVDQIVPEYSETTSDHLPVLARFRLGG